MKNNKILLSIKPEYVKSITNGTKKYEYRKICAKKDVHSIIIYATTPIKRVVAEVEITDVLICPPSELWKKTKNQSGVTKDFFDLYFKNKKLAYAYKLGKVKKFSTPRELKYYGVKLAPQSFIYL